MLHVLWLIPLLPVLAFVVLAVAGGRMGRRALAAIGVVPVACAAVLAVATAVAFSVSPPAGHAFDQVLWSWLQVGDFTPRIALYLDPLSLVMMLVVTCVGFLILLYSVQHMRGEEGYRRFFAYMNLFVAAMLILVLADDFLVLLVGWEGVGLSSFLLIGFWYREPANGAAARKAFIVTRVGDTALLVGLFLLFSRLGSLNIQQTMASAKGLWAPGAGVAVAAALLILGGALGKSAQLPLQTWLPDAMAGPSPVSALIHAATMVTAGVYLVARTHVLFELAPGVRVAVAVIGAATLLYGGFSALAQTDIKRVLAYSTISQIGYMFLALGVGAYSAAIFHFMTHAFFKALLFLAAGVVIQALGGEHDIRKMGGLRRELPVVFWIFLVGAASLSALPLITAGFFSKDLVIGLALSSEHGSVWLWLAGVVGALVTSLYAFRLVFLVFFGVKKHDPGMRSFGRMTVVPMLVLALGAIVAGWIQLPQQWVHLSVFTDFLQPALPLPLTRSGGFTGSWAPQAIVIFLSLAGLGLAYLCFVRRVAPAVWVTSRRGFQRLTGLALAGWGFDRLYGTIVVRPFLWLARNGKGDVIDRGFSAVVWLVQKLNLLLRRTQSGRLRYYVGATVLGVLVFVAVGLLR
jgi:NADH-quinone oxidoreductase subunit L